MLISAGQMMNNLHDKINQRGENEGPRGEERRGGGRESADLDGGRKRRRREKGSPRIPLRRPDDRYASVNKRCAASQRG